jgi:hypothetical protein
VGQPTTPLRRGFIYGAIGTGVTLTVMAVIAVVVGEIPVELLLAASFWAAFLGGASFVIGACQPVPRAASSLELPKLRTGFWARAGRWLYALVVGLLMAMVFSNAAGLVWFGAVYVLESGALVNVEPKPTWWYVAQGAAVAGMVDSTIAAFVASLLGPFLGAMIETPDARSLAVRTAVWAGALGIVLGSMLGAMFGSVMGFNTTTGILGAALASNDVSIAIVPSFGVLNGIAAAGLACLLVRRQDVQPEM